MKGLELSRAYYEEIGQPMLKELFPGLYPRAAAGLAGEGSECYGWDDELSRDHDFGPGFSIWLSDEDYLKYGKDLQRAYDALPKDFGGFPARNTSGRGDGRVGVMPLRAFYARYIGEEQPPRSNLRWFMMQDEFLSSATNGEVFYDGAGDFSRVRDALLAYYPEDVRVKKIVACAGKMAQAGQYNYLRCVKRREYVQAFAAQLGEQKIAVQVFDPSEVDKIAFQYPAVNAVGDLKLDLPVGIEQLALYGRFGEIGFGEV